MSTDFNAWLLNFIIYLFKNAKHSIKSVLLIKKGYPIVISNFASANFRKSKSPVVNKKAFICSSNTKQNEGDTKQQ
jgi:hypothetical protein